MKRMWLGIGFLLVLLTGMASTAFAAPAKLHILVVDSYHQEYLWSQETHKGLCAAFRDFKFLDNDPQIAEYTKNDFVETDSAVIKKLWMDTKRKSKKEEITAATANVMREVVAFTPDIIFLGDDNATNYVGAKLINTSTPVVFWGVDLNPLKYGYIDSFEHPGHNITGVYQPGYYKEGIENLIKLLPDIKTFAILSDDSETGRAKGRSVAKLAEKGQVPLKLVDEVYTNSFSEWKTRARELQDKVDAFFVVNHSTLKDDQGNSIDSMKAGAWYLFNIKKPEAVPEEQFILEGMLLTADDSGYKQGYEAGRMADDILRQKKNPADIAIVAPERGAIFVNKQRAAALGIDLANKNFIEEYIEGSKALEKYPQP